MIVPQHCQITGIQRTITKSETTFEHNTLQTGDVQRPELRNRDPATVFDTTGFTQTVQIVQEFGQGQFGQLSQGTHANRIQSNTEIGVSTPSRYKVESSTGRKSRPFFLKRFPTTLV